VKKFAWCSDTHLDFIDHVEDVDRVRRDFIEPLVRGGFDGVVFTGDISTGEHLVRHMKMLDSSLGLPIYFVCGNHDFYGSSMEAVRAALRELCSSTDNLKYLSQSSYIPLTPRTALVGHDGWYDAYHGEAFRSGILMNDWLNIAEYYSTGAVRYGGGGIRPHMGIIVALSRKFAVEACQHVEENIHGAVAAGHTDIIVATHVPPFVEAHVHNGKSGSPQAHPWYTSKLMGDTLRDMSYRYPRVKFNVFCGHTHGKGKGKISDNLMCYVAGAEYGSPAHNTMQVK